MPVRVDADIRRQQIVAAAFRLIVAEGMEGMSLRKVAEESGINIGSIRHYFDGHHGLLTAAAEEAGNRMAHRLAKHPTEQFYEVRGDAALEALQALVETILPVDDARRHEAIVVNELIMASRTMPVFHDISRRMGVDLLAVLHGAFDALDIPEPDLAAAQVAAMIGGLTIDTITPHGDLSVEQLQSVLRAHLRLLLAAAGRL